LASFSSRRQTLRVTSPTSHICHCMSTTRVHWSTTRICKRECAYTICIYILYIWRCSFLLLDMLGTKAQAGIGSIPCIRSGTSFGSGARQSLGPNPCPIHPERRLALSYIYIYICTRLMAWTMVFVLISFILSGSGCNRMVLGD
jgi:hypothetical protein